MSDYVKDQDLGGESLSGQLSRRRFLARSGITLAGTALIGCGGQESEQSPSAVALPATSKQNIVEVADGVYAAFADPSGDISANSGFVIGQDAVWVFDAQRVDYSTELLAQIQKLTTAPVKYLIHSHHHREIVEGTPVFTEALIVAHSGMRKNLIEEPRPGVRLPDVIYEEQLTFHDGNRELHLIHLGRYHTDGDSVLFLPQEKVLFSGDLLPGKGGPGGMRQAYLQEFVQTIDKALALDFETLVPGRGDSLATKDDLRRFQSYLTQVLTDVQTFIDGGASLEQTLAGVKVPDYIDPARRGTESFANLWRRTIERVYAELTGPSRP